MEEVQILPVGRERMQLEIGGGGGAEQGQPLEAGGDPLGGQTSKG